MADTIRQLTQTLKLKDLIIVNFIPDEYLRAIEQRAVWNNDEDAWKLQHLEITGKNLGRLCRPVSHPKLRRPETNFTRMK